MKRFVSVLILATIFALAISGCKVKNETYTSSFTMYVNHNLNMEASSSIPSTDISASQSMAETYIAIVKSYTVMEQVIEQENLSMTAQQLIEKVTGTQVGDSNIVKFSVTTEDPALSKRIAEAIATIAPEAIERIVEGTSVKIVDRPRLPTRPD